MNKYNVSRNGEFLGSVEAANIDEAIYQARCQWCFSGYDKLAIWLVKQ